MPDMTNAQFTAKFASAYPYKCHHNYKMKDAWPHYVLAVRFMEKELSFYLILLAHAQLSYHCQHAVEINGVLL